MAKSKTETRNGKHKRSKVRVQLVVERDTKAILVYTATLLNVTLTGLLLDGGLRCAQGAGVIDKNFKVLAPHSNGVVHIREMLEAQEGDK